MTTIERLQQELRTAGVKATVRAQVNPLAGGVVNVMVNPDEDATFQEVDEALCVYLGIPVGSNGRKMLRLLDERYAALNQ